MSLACEVDLSTNANMGKGTEKPEYVQEPQNDDDDNYRVQNGFDRSLHWYIAVDEPKQDSYDYQNDYDVY